jgi:hypothetical protein
MPWHGKNWTAQNGVGVDRHRTDTFKLSNDPLFVETVYDVVGLYLNPPEATVIGTPQQIVGEVGEPSLDPQRPGAREGHPRMGECVE